MIKRIAKLFFGILILQSSFVSASVDELSEIPKSGVAIYEEHRLVAEDSFGVDGQIQLYSLNNDTEV